MGLKTNSTENKKKTEIHASADGQNLKVRVNGKDRQVRGDVWTSSYWKLADGRFHNKAVPLLDPESGKDFSGQLQYVATEKLNINNQLQEVFRFRVTNVPSPIELWFDRYHRLVLLLGARTPELLPYQDQLDEWISLMERLGVELHLTVDEATPGWLYGEGVVAKAGDLLRRLR